MKIYIDQTGTTLCSEEHFTLNVVLEPFDDKEKKKRIKDFEINTNNDWSVHSSFPKYKQRGEKVRFLIDLPYMPHIKQNIKAIFKWITRQK